MKTALGLLTSSNIIQNHRGRLEVASEVGKGSTFTVIIPMELKEEAASQDGDDAPAPGHRCEQMTSHRCDKRK